MLLSQLETGEAYAFAPNPEDAWAQGSARKAYFLKRLHSRNEIPLIPAIDLGRQSAAYRLRWQQPGKSNASGNCDTAVIRRPIQHQA